MLTGASAFAGARAGGPAGTPPGGFTGGVAVMGSAVAVPGGVITNSGGFSTTGPISPIVSRIAITDAQGQFSFQRLPAGQFTLSANRNQFLSTSYGQKRPGTQGTPIQLADGQQVKVTIPMMRGGVISGMVLGDDGEPQSNARVSAWRFTMTSGERRLTQANGTSTDDRGIYRLSNLQPGDYLVSATANSDAFLSSRMMSEMEAIERAIASGAIEPPAAPGLPSTVVLPPPPPPQQGPVDAPPGYLPTFFPGTAARSNASMIHVNGGDERGGTDIQVQLIQATNIVGSISGALPPNQAVQVSYTSDDPLNQANFSTRAAPDGRFTLRDVAPGRYTVLAQTVGAPQVTIVNGVVTRSDTTPTRPDDAQRLWGRAMVAVDGGQPTVSVEISLQPARSISGMLVFDMERPPDLSRSRLTVTLSQPPGTPSFSPLSQAPVGPDGHFTLTGVVPGKYSLRAGGFMKSAIVEGQDTLDFPVDFTGDRDISGAVLTLTDKVTEISGTVTDAAGKPASDYTIIAAAADQRFWTPGSRRIVLGRVGADGRYVFRSLPPGDYLVAAVTDLEQGGQYDPEFLKTLAGASMRVRLGEGMKLSQDLRIGR